MRKITSLQNPRFRSALQLHRARGRQKQGRIIIFGQREIARAVSAGIELCEVFFREPTKGHGVDSELLPPQIFDEQTAFELPSPLFDKLQYGHRTDAAIAVASRPATELSNIPCQEKAFLLVLQGLEKPGNLGAIIRTADAAAVDGVVVVDSVTDVFHPNSIRASMGTIFSVPIAAGSSAEIKTWLQQHEFRLVVAHPTSSARVFEIDLTAKTAVVLGSEATGLSPDWDMPGAVRAHLPMQGLADSLNVSVTAAVIAYEAFRQRDSNPLK